MILFFTFISNQFTKEFSQNWVFFSLIQSTKIPCELCSTDEEHVEATQFCKTCNDPEPLCEMCAKHHLRQTLSKNHEMCADMEQFLNKRKTERYFLVSNITSPLFFHLYF